jgi:carboxymethylenebutenolidase
MGGGLALSATAESSEYSAVVAFYGRPLDPGDVAKLKVPVLGLYGEEDQSIPIAAIHEFQGELNKNKVANEFHIYPGAGHAFFNDTRPGIYRAEAAADAWGKTLAWFRQYLG